MNWMKTNKKSYLINITLSVSGLVPDMVRIEHVKANIQSAIDEAVGEIELCGEYYGDFDEVWSLFLDGNAIVNAGEYSVTYCSQPFCEHCGEKHQDFGAEIHVNSTSWCLDCYESNNEKYFSEEDINKMYEEEKKLTKEYYIKKLKEMGEYG